MNTHKGRKGLSYKVSYLDGTRVKLRVGRNAKKVKRFFSKYIRKQAKDAIYNNE